MKYRVIRADFPVHIYVEKDPMNEVEGNNWVPQVQEVVDRINAALKRGSDDYGWNIVSVAAVDPWDWGEH